MATELLSVWARVRRAVLLAPWAVRVPLAYVAAVDQVLDGDLVSARGRLLKLAAAVPTDELLDRVPVKLLLARALLETGDPASAAALFPQALRPAQHSRHLLNETERSFLKFMGNEIYERATQQLGRPSSLEIGVSFDEIDLTGVSNRLRRAFPYVERGQAVPLATYH